MNGLRRVISLIAIIMLCVGVAQAYEHEVWQSGSLYYWKTFNVERGSSSDLATAINGCLGSGNREIHILCGGSLYSTIRIPGNSTKIYGHNNSFAKNHNELGVSNGYNGFELYDFTLTGGTSTSQHGIRSTGASNLRFVNVKVLGSPWIGIRIDSKSSEAWTAWVSNLYMENITVENCGSHGVETYSIDGVDMYGMVARNCGDCGVLNNRCEDINIGTIDAYRCAVNNHYAGYRQANDCGVARINRIVSNQCGRGIYIMGGSRDTEINSVDVRDCYYRGITTGDTGSNPVRVNSGTVTGTAGGYDIDIWDPTNVCIRVNGTTYGNACGSSGITGTKKIINRASGKGMDAGGNSNGSNVQIWTYWGGSNQKWNIADLGSSVYSIRSYQSGNLAADVWNWGTGNGTNIALYTYWGGNSQKYYFASDSGYYRITPYISSGQCLDAYGTADGSNVGTWSYWGGTNQQWSVQAP